MGTHDPALTGHQAGFICIPSANLPPPSMILEQIPDITSFHLQLFECRFLKKKDLKNPSITPTMINSNSLLPLKSDL